MQQSSYVDPIGERYASAAMRELFSPRVRALTWRDLWIALASAQHQMGLGVSAEQVRELQEQRDNLDLARIAEHEKRLRHDVMAHVHGFGEVAPGARRILHLGATSCFVTDNADLIIMRHALDTVGQRLLRMIHALGRFARQHEARPTLGFTHLQPAQLTTVGKRATLWIQDLVEVWRTVSELRRRLPLRGVKGTTGTQASFLHLCDGDAGRVEELERRVTELVGFEAVFPLTGQTYPRLWDFRILNVLAELAAVLHKLSTDLRLLQSWGEVEEPYEKDQVGSSAMPYKRNPMRSERIGALSKYLLGLPAGIGIMVATQWLERTLDDSALRRVTLPQAFLTADALLIIGRNIAEGLTVNTAVIERRIADYLPFLAAEELLMEGVSRGGDRQQLHERLRQLSWEAAESLKSGAGENPLRARLEADPELGPLVATLPPWDAHRFVGLAPQQAERYLSEVVEKLPVPGEDHLRELSV